MTPNQSRIISRVLSPAVRLWVRSQVSQVEDLHVKIEGRDRQILTGYIPRVSLGAQHAVYQGLHLSQIQLVGENIRINLGQVLKGKPLHLLEPVPVTAIAVLEEAHLAASLQSPLLSTALTELLSTLLNCTEVRVTNTNTDAACKNLENQQISWEKVAVDTDTLTVGGSYTDARGNSVPVVIRTSLHLASSHELRLDPLEIQIPPYLPVANLDGFLLDLGSEVALEELTLTPGQIVCRAGITVIP